MKKLSFAFFSIVLCFLLSFPVFAKSQSDPNCFILFEGLRSDEKEFVYVWERSSDSMRSVYFTDDKGGFIIDGVVTTFYSGIVLKSEYPRNFWNTDKHTLAVHPRFKNYNLYYYNDSSISSSGYINFVSNFDYEFANLDEFLAELAKYDSYAEFIKQMDADFDRPGSDDNKLPMLHYKMSAKNVISFPNIVDKKISIDWDFSNLEPYASDPMAYAIEIMISANFYPNSEGERICWDASNSAINQSCKRTLSAERSLLDKPYSFIYLKEGDALYSSTNHIFATDELQDGYYLYIRSFSKDGKKSSNYKVYKCTTGGTSGQMDLTYDTEGNEEPLDESDRDDNADYSNEYDEDSSSSADKDPTGDSYDGNGGYSFDTLYGNLNSMVNMLQGVPELWVHVMSWLPSWFPTFIVTMMGLLIVIGVLKYIF